MIKKKISYRVMKMNEFEIGSDRSVFYKVDCACGDDEDILTFELEVDEEYLTLTTYQKLMWSSYWGFPNWFIRVWSRIKKAFVVLFTGEINVEGSIILSGEEHIQSFIDALEEGKQYVKKSENIN